MEDLTNNPVDCNLKTGIQGEIDALGNQVKELQVLLSESGSIISEGPLEET